MSKGPFHPLRFSLLGKFRNKYLEEFLKPELNDFEFLIAIDLDLYDKWELYGLAHSFGSLKKYNWDMVCANGISDSGTFFDSTAFRDHRFLLILYIFSLKCCLDGIIH